MLPAPREKKKRQSIMGESYLKKNQYSVKGTAHAQPAIARFLNIFFVTSHLLPPPPPLPPPSATSSSAPSFSQGHSNVHEAAKRVKRFSEVARAENHLELEHIKSFHDTWKLKGGSLSEEVRRCLCVFACVCGRGRGRGCQTWVLVWARAWVKAKATNRSAPARQ